MQFKSIIGQSAIRRRLIEMAKEGHIPHAQLLTGPAGVGKLQLAIAFAQYLACSNPSDSDSCGQCPSCRLFEQLQHPDLHFVFPVNKTGDTAPVSDDYIQQWRTLLQKHPYFDEPMWFNHIGADNKMCYIYERESGEIIRKLNFKSFQAEFKTMIIWHPERMNGDILANKLLKLLEEPPEKTLFFFVTEHPEKLLPTIISRLQLLQVPRLTEQEIAEGLLAHHPQLSATDAADYAHIANGSYLRAQQMLDQSKDTERNFAYFTDMMRKAWLVGNKKDYGALLQLRTWSDEMADKAMGREKRRQFLEYAQHLVRENFILNLHQEQQLNYLTHTEMDFSKRFAPFINERNVVDIMNELALAQRQIEQNGNAKIIFFDLCLKMIVLLKR